MSEQRNESSAATTVADDLLDAIGELYGNGDVRFDSETPRRAAVEARAALVAEIERSYEALLDAERRALAYQEFIAYTDDYFGERLPSQWKAHAKAVLADA